MAKKILIIVSTFVFFAVFLNVNSYSPETNSDKNDDIKNSVAETNHVPSYPKLLLNETVGSAIATKTEAETSIRYMTPEELASEITHTPEVLNTEEENEERTMSALRHTDLSDSDYDEIISAVIPNTETSDSDRELAESTDYSEAELKEEIETFLYNAHATEAEINETLTAVLPSNDLPREETDLDEITDGLSASGASSDDIEDIVSTVLPELDNF